MKKHFHFLLLPFLLLLLANCTNGRFSLGNKPTNNSTKAVKKIAIFKKEINLLKKELKTLQTRSQLQKGKIALLQEQQTVDKNKIKQLQSTLTTNFALLEKAVTDQLKKNNSKESQPITTNTAPYYKLDRENEAIVKPAKIAKDLKKDARPLMSNLNNPKPFKSPVAALIIDDTRKKKNRVKIPDPNLKQHTRAFKLVTYKGAKKIYNKAMANIIEGRYHPAINLFKQLLSKYPNDQYSDNSHYWIGRAYFTLGNLTEAEKAFRYVLTHYEHYPTSRGYKTPDAIYMLGKIYESRANKKAARYYYTQVIKRYPKEPAAKMQKMI